MKQLLLLLLFALSSLAATAQDALPSHFSVGYSSAWPLNKFKSGDFDEAYPPFATAGSLLQLNYTHALKQPFALGATLAWRSNPFDMDRFVKPDDALALEKESAPWRTVFTLADAQLQTAGAGAGGIFYLKGSVGAAFCRSVSYTIATPFGKVIRPADRSTALAYGLGAGMKAQLFDRFGLGLEAGILSARPEFSLRNTQGEEITYRQSMTTLNLGALAFYAF